MYKLVCLKKKNTKRCIHCLEDFKTEEYTNYCPNIKTTCPNGDWNFQCPECAKEWICKKKKCPMCKTNIHEDIIIEIKSDNDEEKDCISLQCSCNCQTTIFPEDYNIVENLNDKLDKTKKVFKIILGILLFELTGIIVSSLWIYIFICKFNIYKFNDMVIQDLWKQWIYYYICPIITCAFLLVLIFCRNWFNWCKTYDSITN